MIRNKSSSSNHKSSNMQVSTQSAKNTANTANNENMQGLNDEYKQLSSGAKVRGLREIISREEKKVGSIQVVETLVGSKQLTRNGRAFIRLLYSTSRFTNREIAEAVSSNPSAVKRVVENRYGKNADDLSRDEDIYATYITHTMNLQKFANELPPLSMKKSTSGVSTIIPTLPPSKQEQEFLRDRNEVEEEKNRGKGAKQKTVTLSLSFFNLKTHFATILPPQENIKTTNAIEARGVDDRIDEESTSDASSDESNIFKTKTVAHFSDKGAESDAYNNFLEEEQFSKDPGMRPKTTSFKEKRARFSIDQPEARSVAGKLPPSPVSTNETPSKPQKRKCEEMESLPLNAPSSSKIAKRCDTDDDRRRITGFFKSRGYYLSAVIDGLVEAGFGPTELELLRGKPREVVAKQLVKWGDLRRIKADALAQAIESATAEDWRKLVA
ncbi:hypothetical protein JR316_0013369 [Psilocybe cubensis]|uniref:Uncharacterized protein n=2 Tax=Psilocybe cubensis TaxID=181762 RepID=A0ACB8GH99_PSICU|nr:hypothetical protein JR316_0013369 [Psilocybe cubensis]KAH9474901.1 hypothetical protein JR316_0013369 [Psilocybe cubensis]